MGNHSFLFAEPKREEISIRKVRRHVSYLIFTQNNDLSSLLRQVVRNKGLLGRDNNKHPS